MIGREEFWSRVDAALDARRDPFADEAVLEALLDQPEEVAAVQRLAGRLGELERRVPESVRLSAEPVAGRPATPFLLRPFALAAAAVVLVFAAATWLQRDEAPHSTELASASASAESLLASSGQTPAPALPATSRVLHWQVSHERRVTALPAHLARSATAPSVVSTVASAGSTSSATERPSRSRLVRFDLTVETSGARRGGTRVVLGPDGALSITRTAGSPLATGGAAGALLASTLPQD